MEEELRCAACKQRFSCPVLLPCHHAVCLGCLPQGGAPAPCLPPSEPAARSDASDSDLASLCSEADSGVACSPSRPSSYAGSPRAGAPTGFPAGGEGLLACPTCSLPVLVPDPSTLPRYRLLQNVVDRLDDRCGLRVACQLCEEGGSARPAAVFCEQCEIFYCEECRIELHPARGPLARHVLSTPAEGRARLREQPAHCPDHRQQPLAAFCVAPCQVPVCRLCVRGGAHAAHDVRELAAACKLLKAELSKSLQQLSERAKSTTERVQSLKAASGKIRESCSAAEAATVRECDRLIGLLQSKKAELVEQILQARDGRLQRLRELQVNHSSRFQRITGLLHFCIEALKEPDALAFLQAADALIQRVASAKEFWSQEEEMVRKESACVNLTLDDKPLQRAIRELTFAQTKASQDGSSSIHVSVPAPPTILLEGCSSENNNLTIAWSPHAESIAEGFILELDDGSGGSFKEMYRGINTACTVGGLHFNSVYRARVKSFNSIGTSLYSDTVAMETSEAWFTFDPLRTHREISVVNDGYTVVTQSFDQRVSLGTVGFSRGVHYWEFTIDRYDGTADPAFGVAKTGVLKEHLLGDMPYILGKDDLGWAMYIDSTRSWFVHGDCHDNRVDGGISVGTTIGVLLDLDRKCIRFYVDEEPQVRFSIVTGNSFFVPGPYRFYWIRRHLLSSSQY